MGVLLAIEEVSVELFVIAEAVSLCLIDGFPSDSNAIGGVLCVAAEIELVNVILNFGNGTWEKELFEERNREIERLVKKRRKSRGFFGEGSEGVVDGVEAIEIILEFLEVIYKFTMFKHCGFSL